MRKEIDLKLVRRLSPAVAGLPGPSGHRVWTLQAAAPPPNDNLTNAQGLAGVSGSVIGSNVGATAEKNEPPSETYTGNQAGATIWYTWTCPVTSVVNFNTRGSYTTNVPPAPLPTVISVYTLSAGSVASLTNLSLVNANAVDDNTNAAPDVSRVYFEGIAGTTYYIQVDGKENLATGSYWEGNIVLNWRPNPFAGEFMLPARSLISASTMTKYT
jgi:hypothetical protein